MGRFVRMWSLALVLPLLATPDAATALTPSRLPAFCHLAPDSTSNTWKGAGITPGATTAWEQDANWSTGTSPLTGDQDVCIPAGGTPRIAPGEEEHLRTLDIAPGARTLVDHGGKLFLYGSQTAGQDSVVRAGGHLDVEGATFGGIARLRVLGTFVLANHLGAATIVVRDCSYDPTPGPAYPGEEACTSPDPTPVAGPRGRLEIADGGALDVKGGGVNLGDAFVVVVRGLMRVRAGAYVAADHGTRLELRPHETSAAGRGTLRFEGDGGYLEGKIESDTGVPGLSVLVNQGLILKSGGTGQTLVSAAYSQPSPGAVTVRSGTLLLPTGSVTPARVLGGVGYGTGRCAAANAPACTTSTTPDFPQSALLRVPSHDPDGADVVVRALSAKLPGGGIGFPYEVHADRLDATAASPAVIELRFDASILHGKRWPTVRIYRKSGSAALQLIGQCSASGKPPTGEVACVDRRAKPSSSRNVANSSGAPDVIMVVRTTKTSRWIGR